MDTDCPFDMHTLDQYLDGELGNDQAEQVARHVQACQTCRRYLAQNRFLADYLHQSVDSHVLPKRLARIDPFSARSRKSLSPRIMQGVRPRWLIPAGALAMAGLMGLIFMPSVPSVPASPSAIVTSFSGEISSVTIMETPHQRQTIIWINEEGDGNGNAV